MVAINTQRFRAKYTTDAYTYRYRYYEPCKFRDNVSSIK